MESETSREEKIALYDKLVATHPHAVRKGDTMPYTSLNGTCIVISLKMIT